MEAEESRKETEEKKIDMICKLSWWIYVYDLLIPCAFYIYVFFCKQATLICL